MESLEPYLERLMMCKAFPELSQTEKEYVLESLSEEDYNKYREFLSKSTLALKTADHALVLSPEIATNLKKAFRARHKKIFIFPGSYALIHFRLPVLHTGLGFCVALFFVYLFIQDYSRNPQVAPKISKKNTLDIKGLITLPELKQESVLLPQTQHLSNNLNPKITKSAMQTEPKTQQVAIINKATASNTIIEEEKFALATNIVAEADTLEEEMFDPSALTIPGLDVNLLIPETSYN